jgi:hypothetical protein
MDTMVMHEVTWEVHSDKYWYCGLHLTYLMTLSVYIALSNRMISEYWIWKDKEGMVMAWFEVLSEHILEDYLSELCSSTSYATNAMVVAPRSDFRTISFAQDVASIFIWPELLELLFPKWAKPHEGWVSYICLPLPYTLQHLQTPIVRLVYEVLSESFWTRSKKKCWHNLLNFWLPSPSKQASWEHIQQSHAFSTLQKHRGSQSLATVFTDEFSNFFNILYRFVGAGSSWTFVVFSWHSTGLETWMSLKNRCPALRRFSRSLAKHFSIFSRRFTELRTELQTCCLHLLSIADKTKHPRERGLH